MQSNINSLPGRLGVVGIEIEERIKCRGWVRIQKCFTQPRLANFAFGQILPLIPGITKTQLPVPRPEIIAKFSHLTTQANIEKGIPVGELVMSGTGVVSASEPNPGSHRETGAVREEIWNSCIGNSERIKRIRDWHADIEWTKDYVSARDLKGVGHKRHTRHGHVEK